MKKPSARSFWKIFALAGVFILAIVVFAFLLASPLQKSSPTPPLAAVAATTIPFTKPATQPVASTNPALTTALATPKFSATTTTSTAAPTPTLAATFTPALTPTQEAGEPGLTVISPTVAVGELISVPWMGDAQAQVYRTDDPPLLSLQDARKLVYDRSMNWALGGYFEGKRVTLTAVYGLVTLGEPNTGGNKQGWLGPQNFDLPTCDARGTCVPSGTILPQVIKRPMWVLDYGNTDFPAAGQACMTTPCPTEQIFTNSVYIVDAQTRTIFTASFFTKP